MTATDVTPPANNEAGFSLLEALIALSILAIAAAALIGASEAHIDRVGGLEDRAIASWVADEQLIELRLTPTARVAATYTREMGGQTWQVDVAPVSTDDPDLLRVDIAVRLAGARDALTRLSGFVDIGASR